MATDAVQDYWKNGFWRKKQEKKPGLYKAKKIIIGPIKSITEILECLVWNMPNWIILKPYRFY